MVRKRNDEKWGGGVCGPTCITALCLCHVIKIVIWNECLMLMGGGNLLSSVLYVCHRDLVFGLLVIPATSIDRFLGLDIDIPVSVGARGLVNIAKVIEAGHGTVIQLRAVADRNILGQGGRSTHGKRPWLLLGVQARLLGAVSLGSSDTVGVADRGTIVVMAALTIDLIRAFAMTRSMAALALAVAVALLRVAVASISTLLEHALGILDNKDDQSSLDEVDQAVCQEH